MKNMLKFSIFLVVTCVSAPIVGAQDTDAAQKVSDALTAYGAVPVTVVTQKPRQIQICHIVPPDGGEECIYTTVYDPVSTTTNSILTATNIRTVKVSNMVWGTITKTELPDQIIVVDALYQNCYPSSALTANISISKAFQRSSSLTLTRQVTHTQSTQVGASIKIGDSFSVSAQVTDTNSVMEGTAKVNAEQETITVSVGGNQQVASLSSIMAEMEYWPVQYTVQFTATVTIDADLSKNDKGFTHLSDIMSEANRTFNLAGVVTADDSDQSTLRTFSYPYDPATCKNATGFTIVQNFIPPTTTKLHDASKSLTILPAKKILPKKK